MSATTWLENGKADRSELVTLELMESFNENKTTLILHCVGCGKFKDKRSLSKKCTVCLFGMSTKEAIKRGFIHA